MDKIDRVIVRDGLKAFAKLRRNGHQIPRISFNFSMAKLSDSSFESWLLTSMHESGLSPKDVGIEILETVLIDGNNPQIVSQVRRLHELGFSIELDDFGSGHASLSVLTDLPVNRIKIDRSLVQGVASDSTSRVILEMLVATAHQLDIESLAEGLESQEQMQIVSEIGCDVGQGFYLCEPISCEDLEQWILSDKTPYTLTKVH